MRRINSNELKAIQIELLNSFDLFCKKNNLHYWLDYGTLLGAVRHQGYIPWDDDLDIGMLREDYEKAIMLFNSQNNKAVAFMTPQNSNDYKYPFGKLISTNTVLFEYGKAGIKTGVYVDVFPYDNCPQSEKAKERIFRKRDLWGRLRRLRLPMRDGIKGIKKAAYILGSIFIKLFPSNWIERQLDKNARRYENRESDYVCNFADPYDYKYLKIPKKLFLDFTTVKFENGIYPAPANYDYWLRRYYGDYMELPPTCERVGHHVFEAYYIEAGSEEEKREY